MQLIFLHMAKERAQLLTMAVGYLIKNDVVHKFNALWGYVPKLAVAKASGIDYARFMTICRHPDRGTRKESKLIANAMSIDINQLEAIIDLELKHAKQPDNR